MQKACDIPWVQSHKKTMPATPDAYISQNTLSEESFFIPSSSWHPWPLQFPWVSSVCSCVACLYPHVSNPAMDILVHFVYLKECLRCVSWRTLLSARLLNLACESNTDQSVVWLELLQCLWGVVDESETGSLSTTELSLETEDVYLVLVGLVKLGEFASKLILGDIGSVWV